MYSRMPITKSTGNYSQEIEKLQKSLDLAEAIVIGAGAGLSTAAGFTYFGERFHKYFADFENKYGFHDMYSGSFCRYDTLEEYWAYWSRFIVVNRYMEAPKPVYNELFELVKTKDYFVITTNVDHCFQKAGFDKKRLFYTQGDYGLFQCSEPCCQETFENEDTILNMVDMQNDMCIPTELLPVCPHCGKPMTMNLRSDNRFVEDAGWYIAAGRYEDFLKDKENLRVLFLELGVGYNTPGIIKYPFWLMTMENPKATYACVNFSEAVYPTELERQSICIDSDIARVLKDLR